MKMNPSNQEQKTRNLRLTRAAKNPMLALEKGWFEDPKFCQGFFDRCDDMAFVMSRETLALTHRAVHIAERNGDPHLINRSYGVLSHGYIVAHDPFWAGKVLEGARRKALACCPRCRSEQLRREGDLLGEQRVIRESLEALNNSLAEAGEELDPDTRARTVFLRSISYYHDGQRARSIADIGATLADLSLTSPRGYLVEGVAALAVFALGGGPEDDKVALAHANHVLDRVRGLEPWADLRRRASWVKAHFHANLGDVRRARELLESAIQRLFVDGLAREVVAAILDLSQLRCRHPEPREDGLKLSKMLIARCLQRRTDLPVALREGLEQVLSDLKRYPEDAFKLFYNFRRSFIAPVPGLLGDRMGCR